jgi:hypothetical protein
MLWRKPLVQKQLTVRKLEEGRGFQDLLLDPRAVRR